MLTLSGPINILFSISQSAAGAGEEENLTRSKWLLL